MIMTTKQISTINQNEKLGILGHAYVEDGYVDLLNPKNRNERRLAKRYLRTHPEVAKALRKFKEEHGLEE